MKHPDFPGFDIVEPMKIHAPKNEQDLMEKINSGAYIGSIKKDGALYQIQKNAEGNIGIFSRTISKKNGFFVEKSANVPHIVEWAKDNLPNNSTILTEIYYPNKTSKDVTKIMGCLPSKAIQRQEGNPIHCYIHDVLQYNNQDYIHTPFWQRNELLHQEIMPYKDYIEVAQTWGNNLPSILEEVFAAGEEGMVFKKANEVYYPGKRPVDVTVKAKTEYTFDAIITGFIEPEKFYTGKDMLSWPYTEDGVPVTKAYYNKWIAGFTIGAYENNTLITFGNISSGMTDELREGMAREPEKYLGKVVSIKAMSVNKEDMTVRHGFLKEFHADKNQNECKIQDIFK